MHDVKNTDWLIEINRIFQNSIQIEYLFKIHNLKDRYQNLKSNKRIKFTDFK